MLKKTIYILTIIFTVSSVVFTQGKKMYDGPPPDEMNNIMFFEKAGIVLSDKQKDLIKNCSFTCNENIKVYNIELRKYMEQIREELMKEKSSRENLKALIQKKKMIEADIEYLRIERDLTILETLTKEQKVKLDEFRNSFMKKKGWHHEGMMDGKK